MRYPNSDSSDVGWRKHLKVFGNLAFVRRKLAGAAQTGAIGKLRKIRRKQPYPHANPVAKHKSVVPGAEQAARAGTFTGGLKSTARPRVPRLGIIAAAPSEGTLPPVAAPPLPPFSLACRHSPRQYLRVGVSVSDFWFPVTLNRAPDTCHHPADQPISRSAEH